MFGIVITTSKRILDLQRAVEVEKTQTRIANVKLEENNSYLKHCNEELNRKSAHIDQLCKQAREKDEKIKQLEKFRPVQGKGGRFVKKALAQ